MANIGRSTTAHADDYSVGHLALENWGAWLRGIQSPFPAGYPSMSPMFKDMEQRYRDESISVFEQYDPDGAEVTQGIIRLVCKERPTVALHLSYAMRLSKLQAAAVLSRMDKKWNCDDKKYASWLDQAVASIDSAYLTLEHFER